MFAAKAVSSDHVSIYVSRAHTQFLDFKRARIPAGAHLTDHFTVMDTEHEQVFLYVSDHTIQNSIGHLYVSDTLGYRFAHSLDHITKGERHNAVDFEGVKSIAGTYFANRYDATHEGGTEAYVGSKMRPLSEEDISWHDNLIE